MQMNRSKINVLKNKNDNSFEELRKLAKSTKSIKKLRELSENKEWIIRAEVALNSHATEDTLLKLCHDPVWEVQTYVADNPSCTQKVFSELASSDDTDVLYYLVQSKHIPAHMIDWILRHNDSVDEVVIVAAIKTGKVSDQLLNKYCKCSNAVISNAAFQQRIINREKGILLLA